MINEVHPDHWSNGPRVGARGVVVVDGCILLLRYERDGETLYLFPGGGHEPGETLAETAQREVFEETGLTIGVGRLLAMHEHQPSKGFAVPEDIRSIYVGDAHRVDFFFECIVPGEATPNLGVERDMLHTGFAWVAPGDLENYLIIPDIGDQLRDSLAGSADPLLSES